MDVLGGTLTSFFLILIGFGVVLALVFGVAALIGAGAYSLWLIGHSVFSEDRSGQETFLPEPYIEALGGHFYTEHPPSEEGRRDDAGLNDEWHEPRQAG